MSPIIAIIGAGGWGTALAITMARVHRDVRPWVFEPDLARTIREERRNPIYLDGIEVPRGIKVSSSFDEVLNGAGERIHPIAGLARAVESLDYMLVEREPEGVIDRGSLYLSE